MKKDCYAMLLSRSLRHFVFCNVSERVVMSVKSADLTLLSPEHPEVEETSVGMFNLTCTGASLSKNQDLLAVSDFTGTIRLFCGLSTTTKLLKESNLPDQIRYMHFHDFHNHVLLIGTFSGAVYVWNIHT